MSWCMSLLPSYNNLLQMNAQIDWNQLKQNMSSKEISFERFCFHYASIMLKGYGQMTYPYNAAGSEFYLELTQPWEYDGIKYKVGDVIGWQAKFWVNHNDMENSSLTADRRAELKKGFIKTLERVPDLALWIICTPGQFKEDAYSSLRRDLQSESEHTNFTHWHKSIFELSIIGSDSIKYQGLWSYYFGNKTISKDLLDNLTKATLESLNRKFDIDLHTSTTFENQLLSIIDREVALVTLKDKIYILRERLEHYEARWFGEDGEHYDDLSEYGEAFKSAFFDYEKCVLNIAHHIVRLSEKEDVDEMYKDGIQCLVSGRVQFDECATKVQTAIRELPEKEVLNYYFQDIIELKDFIFGFHSYKEVSIEHILKLREARYFPVFAQAGYGKTHFACSLASRQIKNNNPVILLTGSRFRNCSCPQDVFKRVLGLDGMSVSFEELIGALDLLASNYPTERLLIIIDGLNECFPNEQVWADELPLIIKCIENSDHLLLVTTCREKTEYIQKIYGQQSYDKVDNASLLSGIESRNLHETIHKYFRKYDISEESIADSTVFSNPLLLKIFCETNRGRKGFVINGHTLVESMKLYSENLVAKLSINNGAVDRTLQYNISKGLLKLGKILWERNTRAVDYFEDFYPIFKDSSEKLLDEGLCFQVEAFSVIGGEVQFTYDLLAGYHIAKYLVSETKNAAELSALLNTDTVFARLFGSKDELHTLAEDIIRTLIVIVRERENLSLFELVRSDAAFAKILEGLEIMKASDAEQHALRIRLACPLNDGVKKTVAKIAAEKMLDHNSVSGISLLLPAFKQFTREEFDLYFHERFLGYGLLNSSIACIKKNLKVGIFVNDSIFSAVVLSGCFDLKIRHDVLCLIVGYARGSFQNIKELLSECLQFSDPYIREAVYVIIHGAVVGLNNKEDVLSAVQIVAADLNSKPTSHAVLLDYAESLFDYAKTVCQIEVKDNFLLVAKDVVWHVKDSKEISKSGVHDYDFVKYYIRPYSSQSYHSRSIYSVDELTRMIQWRMNYNGYQDDAYASLRESHSDRMRYNQAVVKGVSYKHLRTAHLELVGWLLLNGFVAPEYKHTLRTSEIDIDPSFPSTCKMRQWVTDSLLPRTVEDTKQWLVEDPLPAMGKYLKKASQLGEGKMILLYGYLLQKSEDKEVQFYWRANTRFVSRNTQKKVHLPDIISHSHLLASEIGWRSMVCEEEEIWSDFSTDIFPLEHYEFSGWNQNRAQNRNFYFIADRIRCDCELEFNVQDLTYYRHGKPVTEHFQDTCSEFLYISSEIIEEIERLYDVVLVTDCYAEKIDTSPDDGLGYAQIEEFKSTSYVEMS